MSRFAVLGIATLCLFMVSGCASTPEVAQRGTPDFLGAVTVVDQSEEYEPTKRHEVLHLLAEEVAMDAAQYVGRIRASKNVDVATIDEIMSALQATALRMGGNAFRVEQLTCASDTPTVAAELKVFEVPESLLEENEEHFPKNRVYLFGALHPEADSTTFSVNDQKVVVGPLRYVTNLNSKEGKTTIDATGLFGESLTLKRLEGRPSSYWSRSAFAMSPYASVQANTDAVRGIDANTNELYPVNDQLGRVLVRVLNEQRAP
jgi:hypothetical protein